MREFLTTDLQAFLFSPRAGRAAFIQEAYREGAGVPAKGKWLPGERYSSSTYCDAIARACVKAGVPGWHPHQLRHNSGTRLRREFGIETARTVLGHTSAAMTELYAEADAAKAREAAAKLG